MHHAQALNVWESQWSLILGSKQINLELNCISLLLEPRTVHLRDATTPALQPALNDRHSTLLDPVPQRLVTERGLQRFPDRPYIHERTLFANRLWQIGADVFRVLVGKNERVDAGSVCTEDFLFDAADGRNWTRRKEMRKQ